MAPHSLPEPTLCIQPIIPAYSVSLPAASLPLNLIWPKESLLAGLAEFLYSLKSGAADAPASVDTRVKLSVAVVSVKHKVVLRTVQVPCTVRFPQISALPVLRKSWVFNLKDDNERNRVCESFCLHIRKLLRVFASDPDVKLKSSSE